MNYKLNDEQKEKFNKLMYSLIDVMSHHSSSPGLIFDAVCNALCMSLMHVSESYNIPEEEIKVSFDTAVSNIWNKYMSSKNFKDHAGGN